MSETVKRFGEKATKVIIAAGGILLVGKCIIGFIASVIAML